MATTPTLTQSVYQIRAVLSGVSPLIWRRLQISSRSSIFELHHALQAAMGWSDSYLHAFRVHGREYGIARIGGISFSDDPRQVRLCDFRLRPRERFQYRYNFNSDWELELRIEAILPVDPTRRYPTCIGGQRVTPPEDCGGPQASMELLDRSRSLPIEEMQLVSEVLEKILAGQGRDAVEDWEEFKAAGRRIKNYLKFAGKSFDRRSVNRQLALLTTEDGDSE